MKIQISGKVTVVGSNIDTDQIYPGRFLAITDGKEIGSHCLAGVDESIAENFPEGGIVVAGTNFGCGSSREYARIALLNMGASAVVAESFARIFFRNSINLGLPLILCIKVKANAFVALLVTGLIIGVLSGMSGSDTVEALTTGFSGTVKSIGIIIIFGIMLGDYRLYRINTSIFRCCICNFDATGKSNQ